MRVTHIKIENVLGIEALDIEPRALTVLSGANAAGKTSVLEAIKSVVQGGHDASLVRNGADHGRVVLVLDDGVEIAKRIGHTRSALTVTHPLLGRLSSGKAYLDGLTDALAFNPVQFIAARPADRARWLLESMPITVDPAELSDAVDHVIGLSPEDSDGHALTAIDAVRKRVYDERTATNRTAKEKRASADQLFDAIPDGQEVDPDKLAAKLADTEAAVERNRDRQRALMEEANEQRRQRVEAARAAFERESQAATDERDARHDEILGAATPAREDAQALAAEIRERLRSAERDRQTAALQSQMAQEAQAAEDQARALSAAIDRLDALKTELLGSLPIDDLEVVDGEIFHGGVPFDRLNHATQVRLAMEIASARAGDLGLVCVDGLEALDPEAFQAFREWAEDEGHLQLVVTRVGDGPLAVETSGPAPTGHTPVAEAPDPRDPASANAPLDL